MRVSMGHVKTEAPGVDTPSLRKRRRLHPWPLRIITGIVIWKPVAAALLVIDGPLDDLVKKRPDRGSWGQLLQPCNSH
jgi:hypothetical protein